MKKESMSRIERRKAQQRKENASTMEEEHYFIQLGVNCFICRNARCVTTSDY